MPDTLSKPTTLGNGWYSITAGGDLAGLLKYWRVNGARWHSGAEDTIRVYIQPGSTGSVWCSSAGWGNDADFTPNSLTLQVYLDESGGDLSTLLWQEYSGGSWVTRQTDFCDGRAYYRYDTPPISDGTSWQWRAVPVGVNGNNGTATPFSGTMVTTPNVPDVSYSYSAVTGKARIAAA